jgi:CheY-like chemotaxis protein
MAEKNPAVLVVEDDDDIRHATADFLVSAGYACLQAANGVEALERLPELARPGVVILDVMMPVMDGLEFLEEITRTCQLSALSVVLVTASPTLCDGRTVTDGMPIIRKPVVPSHLLDLVQSRLPPPSPLLI